MAIGMTPAQTWQHVLDEDRDENGKAKDDASVFELGWLDVTQQAKLDDNDRVYEQKAQGSSEFLARELDGTGELEILRAGLRGWENFVDEKGDPIAFEQDSMLNVLGKQMRPPSNKTLGRLRPNQRRELAQSIQAGNTLTEDDRKNS